VRVVRGDCKQGSFPTIKAQRTGKMQRKKRRCGLLLSAKAGGYSVVLSKPGGWGSTWYFVGWIFVLPLSDLRSLAPIRRRLQHEFPD